MIKAFKFESNNWSQERQDNNEVLRCGIGYNGHEGTNLHVDGILPYCRKERKNAIDVGARYGAFAMQFQKAGYKHVYAIEMLPKFMKPMSMNLDLSKATVYNFGAFDRTIKATRSGKTTINIGLGNQQMHSIDDLYLKDIDLIKIDCDGPDRLILNGSIETITKYRPTVYIEFDNGQIEWESKYLKGELKTKDDIWKILREKNLDYEMIVAKWKGSEYIPEQNRANLVLVPKENL